MLAALIAPDKVRGLIVLDNMDQLSAKSGKVRVFAPSRLL